MSACLAMGVSSSVCGRGMKYWRSPTLRGLAAPTIEGGKLTMGVERAVAELGVLIYPGAQMAAVHGLTDLFGVANRIAAEHQAAQLPVPPMTDSQDRQLPPLMLGR